MMINYVLAHATPLPPIEAGKLIEYVIAGNGVFVRARRDEMEAMIPVSRGEIRGLQQVQPYVRLAAGKVPLALSCATLNEFQKDMPLESLVWIGLEAGRWKVVKPRQIQSEAAVRPENPYDPQGAAAFLDVHSHNHMEPFFSTDDDRDENGFRLYAVFGLLDSAPCAAVRVGIYGYFWHLDAGSVFELPEELQDAVQVLLTRGKSEKEMEEP